MHHHKDQEIVLPLPRDRNTRSHNPCLTNFVLYPVGHKGKAHLQLVVNVGSTGLPRPWAMFEDASMAVCTADKSGGFQWGARRVMAAAFKAARGQPQVQNTLCFGRDHKGDMSVDGWRWVKSANSQEGVATSAQ